MIQGTQRAWGKAPTLSDMMSKHEIQTLKYLNAKPHFARGQHDSKRSNDFLWIPHTTGCSSKLGPRFPNFQVRGLPISLGCWQKQHVLKPLLGPQRSSTLGLRVCFSSQSKVRDTVLFSAVGLPSRSLR